MFMRRNTCVVGMFLILSFMANQVRAQTIEPPSLEFGTVMLGESSIESFSVVNDLMFDLAIINIELTSGDMDAFSIDWNDFITVPNGTSTLLDVTFTPYEAGLTSATLTITFDGTGPMSPHPWTDFVVLSGTGEESASQDPVVMINDLIVFFDASIASGALRITGGRWSRWFRYFSMKRTLQYTQRLINAGYYRWAEFYLNSILRRADGLRWPRDYVKGPARVEFAQYVRDLISVLQGSG